MGTLQDYAERTFPNHVVVLPEGNVELSSHTVVAHAVGAREAVAARTDLRRRLPEVRVAVAQVRASEPTVLPTADEDRESGLDVPKRRLAASAVISGGVAGVVVFAVVRTVANLAAAIILGLFAALIVAMAASIIAGGRFAGQRAWSQPNAPDESVTVIAALTDDESVAVHAARLVESAGIFDVRVVDRDGAWHSPHT